MKKYLGGHKILLHNPIFQNEFQTSRLACCRSRMDVLDLSLCPKYPPSLTCRVARYFYQRDE